MGWLGGFRGSRRRFVGTMGSVLVLLGLGEPTTARRGRLRRVAGCVARWSGGSIGSGGADRKAMVFTPSSAGSLRRVQFNVVRSGTGGDYVVQVVRAPEGVPSIKGFDVIAATVVPESSLPENKAATLTARFAGPRLEAGTSYAAVISRPVAALNLVIGDTDGLACPVVLTANGNDPADAFETGGASDSVVFAVFVAR